MLRTSIYKLAAVKTCIYRRRSRRGAIDQASNRALRIETAIYNHAKKGNTSWYHAGAFSTLLFSACCHDSVPYSSHPFFLYPYAPCGAPPAAPRLCSLRLVVVDVTLEIAKCLEKFEMISRYQLFLDILRQLSGGILD